MMLDDSDSMVQCPYDESHMVAKSRLSFHVAKCRKYPKGTFRRCPYNAAHDVEVYNFDKHCAECPDRASVETWATTPGDGKQSVSVPCGPIVLPESEENWDEVEHPTYDPTVKIVDKPLFRSCTGESKAVRKNFRLGERERFRNINVPPPEEAVSAPEQIEVVKVVREEKPAFDYSLPVRVPKGVSKTFAVPTQPPKFVAGVHGMGRGRVPSTETAAPSVRPPPGFEAAAGSHKGKKNKAKGIKSDPPSLYVGLPAPPASVDSDDRALQLMAALTIGERAEAKRATEAKGATKAGKPTEAGKPTKAGKPTEAKKPTEALLDGAYGDWIPAPDAPDSTTNGTGQGMDGWTTLSQVPRERPIYRMPEPDFSHNVPGRGRGRLQQQRDN